jgi:hypothetical protein
VNFQTHISFPFLIFKVFSIPGAGFPVLLPHSAGHLRLMMILTERRYLGLLTEADFEFEMTPAS